MPGYSRRVQIQGFTGTRGRAIMSAMVKRTRKPDDFGRYQIYPSPDLAAKIEKKHKEHPSRMSVSAFICTLLHDYLSELSKK